MRFVAGNCFQPRKYNPNKAGKRDAGKQCTGGERTRADNDKGKKGRRDEPNLHKVALEEFFQLPLRCRIGKVADVEAATFGSAGKDSIVGGGLLVSGLVASQRGVGQSVGNVVDGGGSSVSDFLHDSRHGD